MMLIIMICLQNDTSTYIPFVSGTRPSFDITILVIPEAMSYLFICATPISHLYFIVLLFASHAYCEMTVSSLRDNFRYALSVPAKVRQM